MRRGTSCQGNSASASATTRWLLPAVLARRGVPHTYRNAGDSEAVYLLVMPPRIAQLIEAIHQPGADIPALFHAHDSEILPA